MTAPLWTWDAFEDALGGAAVGAAVAAISGISIDSRTIKPGEAFFAIRGDAFDGHDFVDDALAAGAAVAVVSAEWRDHNPAHRGPVIVVPQVLAALERLGRAARARSDAKIIAVTGSVGKTGTKEALRRALAPSGEVHAAVASFNNHWGVPLTLARMPQSAAFGVFEIGMNHPGEITPLVAMVRPHVAVITTVAPVHMEFFDSLDDIARAKAEIFTGLEPEGVAVINRDMDHYALMRDLADEAGVARLVTFGKTADADARCEKAVLHAGCSCVTATILGDPVVYKIGAPGRHVVDNSLSVLAAVKLVGADLAKAGLAMAKVAAPTGRGARHKLSVGGGTAILIDESYNANPVSMRAAIAVLGQTPVGSRGRRIAVLGDMLELGQQSNDLHADLSTALGDAQIDCVFLCGPHMRALWDRLRPQCRAGYAASALDLQDQVLTGFGPGDALMVKGSLGSRMGPIVTALLDRYASPADKPAAS